MFFRGKIESKSDATSGNLDVSFRLIATTSPRSYYDDDYNSIFLWSLYKRRGTTSFLEPFSCPSSVVVVT